MKRLIGYEVETLRRKEAYYRACGDLREVKWDTSRDSANFMFRSSSGQLCYGVAPLEWLKELGI